MFVVLKRILKFGFLDFWRNKGLSIQVVFIMTVAIGVFSSLFVLKELSTFMLDKFEEKVDISVYFKKDTDESHILAIRDELQKFFEGIQNVKYVSPEQAKEFFVSRHKNDSLYEKALQEVGDNPFLPSLKIKARNPSFYAQISQFLSSSPFNSDIEKVSYYQNKDVINRLIAFTGFLKKTGIGLSVFLVLLVFFVTFNTIKLTIFALKEEIATMRLVGTSNWFLKGPFLIQGILYSLIAIFIVDILFLGVFWLIDNNFYEWMFGFRLLDYFYQNILMLIGWQVLFGCSISLISSLLAVRKYLSI